MAQFRPCKAADCHNLISSDSIAKYCSNACRQRSFRLRQNAKQKVQPQPLSKTCRYCGKRFCTFVASQTYCKTSCRVASYRLNIRLATTEGIIVNK